MPGICQTNPEINIIMLPVSNQFKSNSSLLPKQNLSFGK
jgi:hypothetical protein